MWAPILFMTFFRIHFWWSRIEWKFEMHELYHANLKSRQKSERATDVMLIFRKKCNRSSHADMHKVVDRLWKSAALNIHFKIFAYEHELILCSEIYYNFFSSRFFCLFPCICEKIFSPFVCFYGSGVVVAGAAFVWWSLSVVYYFFMYIFHVLQSSTSIKLTKYTILSVLLAADVLAAVCVLCVTTTCQKAISNAVW